MIVTYLARLLAQREQSGKVKVEEAQLRGALVHVVPLGLVPVAR